MQISQNVDQNRKKYYFLLIFFAHSFNEYFVNVEKSLAQIITSTDDPLSYIDYNNHCISEIVELKIV